MTMQPDPGDRRRTLVEREGVNAGSDRSAVEGDADMVSPQVASQRDDTAARPTSAADEGGSERVAADGHAVGAPATVVGGDAPPRRLDPADGPYPSESGQDNGSIS